MVVIVRVDEMPRYRRWVVGSAKRRQDGNSISLNADVPPTSTLRHNATNASFGSPGDIGQADIE